MKTQTTDTQSNTVTREHIIPTKQVPVFMAHCDYFGYIEAGYYKNYYIPGAHTCGSTFDICYQSAVNRLHQWIIDNPGVISDYPKCKFELYAIDGTVKGDKHVVTKVYEISAAKAKKYLL